MKVNQKQLSDYLKELDKVAKLSKNLAINDTVLIKVNGKVLTMLATDMDVYLRMWIDGEADEVDEENDFVATLPIKATNIFVSTTKKTDAVVDILNLPPKVGLNVDGSLTKIDCPMNVDDFPTTPRPRMTKTIKIGDSKAFKSALDWVSKSSSSDFTRGTLLGVRFEPDCLVATDGHRLHKEIVPDWVWMKDAKSFTLPNDAVGVLVRLMKYSDDDVEVWCKRSDDSVIMVFRTNNWELTIICGKAEQNFPTYDYLVSSKTNMDTVVMFDDADKLIKVLNKKAKLSPKVTLKSSKQEVVLISTGYDFMVETVLPVVSERHKCELIGFNPKYIIEALDKRNGDVTICYSEQSPCKFTQADSPNRLAVVMPIRLKKEPNDER